MKPESFFKWLSLLALILEPATNLSIDKLSLVKYQIALVYDHLRYFFVEILNLWNLSLFQQVREPADFSSDRIEIISEFMWPKLQ